MAPTCRDKLKAEITRMEMEKADLGIELSFQRDRLKLKEAEAQQLELDALELGARLSKSATDYVSWIVGQSTDSMFSQQGEPGFAKSAIAYVGCRNSHNRAACIRQPMRRQALLGTPKLPLGP